MRTPYLRFGWKRNLRKVPDQVTQRVQSFPHDNVVIACVKKIPHTHVAEGRYAHLWIGITGGQVNSPATRIPLKDAGRYSRWNLEGREIVRRDLPKRPKSWDVETPNFGDWGRGSHTIPVTRDVYPRDFYPPKELALQIELLGREDGDNPAFIFRFQVDEVLDRTSSTFKHDLLTNLNLLQENTGAADAFPSDATRADYLGTVYVDWEILPVGERDETIARIFSKIRGDSEDLRRRLAGRYDILAALNPVAFVSGTSGFRRYFGAKFSDRLVVFENLEWGNALYAMFEGWESLSQRSRLDLLGGDREGFLRIIHTEGWTGRLKRLVEERR